MSKTERALDEGIDALDDELDAALAADVDDSDDEVEQLADDGVGDDDVDAVDVDVAVVEAEEDVDDEPYELPEIVIATEDTDDTGTDTGTDTSTVSGADPLLAHRANGEHLDDPVDERAPVDLDPGLDRPAVSDDLLDELRRADIDGPTVAFAPQDDTSSGLQRPRRAPDYDPAPFPIPVNVPRMLGRKPRVRRVTRVVRHVDPWSVFKIAIVANLVLYLILLTAGVLLWNVAYATGTVDNVERFFESFGWSSFEFNGGEIYHNAWIGGLFVVIGLTGLAVLFATLFNLITDLVGGMRFTVLEEEVVEARTSPMRRFVVRRAEPEVPLVTYDESGPIIREAAIDDSGSFRR
ncbi:MAG: DUF3566 domain-containing protein [Ilumatobacteraceae bacterium]